jgi:hypothetical protein
MAVALARREVEGVVPVLFVVLVVGMVIEDVEETP